MNHTTHTHTVLQACGLTMQPRWPWCHSPPALHEVRRSTSMFSSLTVATQTNMPPPSPSFFFSSFSSSKVGKLIEERACACVITCHYTMETVLLQSFKSNIPAVVHKFLPFFFFFLLSWATGAIRLERSFLCSQGANEFSCMRSHEFLRTVFNDWYWCMVIS